MSNELIFHGQLCLLSSIGSHFCHLLMTIPASWVGWLKAESQERSQFRRHVTIADKQLPRNVTYGEHFALPGTLIFIRDIMAFAYSFRLSSD